MASRKSGKDVPVVPKSPRAPLDARSEEPSTRPESERPGSYAKVVGTPRRRRSSHPPIVAEAPGQVDRVGASAAKYQVDRTSSAPPPLEAEPTPAARRGSVAEALLGTAPMKTSLGLGPNLQAEVERVFAERRPSENEAVLTSPSVLEASSVRIDRVRPISTPAPVQIVTRPSQEERSDYGLPSQAPRQRASERPARPSSRETGVLDAKPSFRPSDPIKRQGPSWGMVVGIAALSSIIAAAGVVAVQEMLKDKPVAAESVTPVVDAPEPVAAPRAEPVQVGAAVAEEPAKAPPAAVEASQPARAPQQSVRPVAAPGALRPGASQRVRPSVPQAAAKPVVAPKPAVPVRATEPTNRVLSGEPVAPAAPTTPSASEELPSNPYE